MSKGDPTAGNIYKIGDLVHYNSIKASARGIHMMNGGPHGVGQIVGFKGPNLHGGYNAAVRFRIGLSKRYSKYHFDEEFLEPVVPRSDREAASYAAMFPPKPAGGKTRRVPLGMQEDPEADLRKATGFAQAFADLVINHGGPRVRVWSAPGKGARVYFPGEAGYLSFSRGGDMDPMHRGKLAFNENALYPSWRTAYRKARDEYRERLKHYYEAENARLEAQIVADDVDVRRLGALEEQERNRGGKRRVPSAADFERAMRLRKLG